MATLLYPPPTVTNFIDWLVWMNTVSHGFFWVFSAVGLFFIMFIGLKNYPTVRALATASFVTSIYAIGLRMIGLVSTLYMVLFILVTAISLLFLVLGSDKD